MDVLKSTFKHYRPIWMALRMHFRRLLRQVIKDNIPKVVYNCPFVHDVASSKCFLLVRFSLIPCGFQGIRLKDTVSIFCEIGYPSTSVPSLNRTTAFSLDTWMLSTRPRNKSSSNCSTTPTFSSSFKNISICCPRACRSVICSLASSSRLLVLSNLPTKAL